MLKHRALHSACGDTKTRNRRLTRRAWMAKNITDDWFAIYHPLYWHVIINAKKVSGSAIISFVESTGNVPNCDFVVVVAPQEAV